MAQQNCGKSELVCDDGLLPKIANVVVLTEILNQLDKKIKGPDKIHEPNSKLFIDTIENQRFFADNIIPVIKYIPKRHKKIKEVKAKQKNEVKEAQKLWREKMLLIYEEDKKQVIANVNYKSLYLDGSFHAFLMATPETDESQAVIFKVQQQQFTFYDKSDRADVDVNSIIAQTDFRMDIDKINEGVENAQEEELELKCSEALGTQQTDLKKQLSPTYWNEDFYTYSILNQIDQMSQYLTTNKLNLDKLNHQIEQQFSAKARSLRNQCLEQILACKFDTIVKTACQPMNNSRSLSKYKGVTIHGRKYQVIIHFDKQQAYIGTFFNEIIAAFIQDFCQIQLKGLTGRTNFEYTKAMVLSVLMQNKFEDQFAICKR